MDAITEFFNAFWQSLRANDVNILSNLGNWSYVLLAILVTIEGPIVTVVGAAVAAGGGLQLRLVFAAAMVGNMVADVLWYSLGYAGRLEWFVRYGGWLGVRQEHITTLHENISRHVRKILLIAKLTLSFVIPALVATGLARVHWRRWFPVIFVAESLWTGMLVLVGFYAAESIQQIESGLHQVTLISSLVILLLLIIWTLRQYLKVPELREESDDT